MLLVGTDIELQSIIFMGRERHLPMEKAMHGKHSAK